MKYQAHLCEFSVYMSLLSTHSSSLFILVSDQKHADAEVFFYLLILSSVISSLYTLIWDLKMDWGLFDRNAGENTFLREEIVYPHKVSGMAEII